MMMNMIMTMMMIYVFPVHTKKECKRTCLNGTCLPKVQFFDGVNDCGDNSDEGNFFFYLSDEVF